MEKEPKVFKTLVHKETGEWGAVNSFEVEPTDEEPQLCDPELEISELAFTNIEMYDLEEVVVLKKSEYERLKGDSQILTKCIEKRIVSPEELEHHRIKAYKKIIE